MQLMSVDSWKYEGLKLRDHYKKVIIFMGQETWESFSILNWGGEKPSSVGTPDYEL